MKLQTGTERERDTRMRRRASRCLATTRSFARHVRPPASPACMAAKRERSNLGSVPGRLGARGWPGHASSSTRKGTRSVEALAALGRMRGARGGSTSTALGGHASSLPSIHAKDTFPAGIWTSLPARMHGSGASTLALSGSIPADCGLGRLGCGHRPGGGA
jgi:hypothetical protein